MVVTEPMDLLEKVCRCISSICYRVAAPDITKHERVDFRDYLYKHLSDSPEIAKDRYLVVHEVKRYHCWGTELIGVSFYISNTPLFVDMHNIESGEDKSLCCLGSIKTFYEEFEVVRRPSVKKQLKHFLDHVISQESDPHFLSVESKSLSPVS
jgi:hypothetical protein